MTRHHPARRATDDDGSILPLVLVMSVVIAVIVAALATYVATSLRYGNVVEERADRLAAADGGLRYAIERLQNSAYAGCLSNLGNAANGGFTIDFPVTVNEATVDITCTKGSNGIGDIKAWAIIVTGEGVPNGQPMWSSQGGGGQTKLLGGPVWITDPGRSDLKSPVELEDGDIWYYRADCTSPSLTLESTLTFTPEYRGTICVDEPWTAVYTAPAIGTVPMTPNPPPFVDGSGCTVFSPGRYTSAPALGTNTYFNSGNYYFENVTLDITNATVTAGWADQQWGDQQFVINAKCDSARGTDEGSGSTSGATFYLGGTSKFEIGNKGSIEILRRLQGDSLVSIQVIETANDGMIPSTLTQNNNVVWTKSGNNSDLALHGLLWAPEAKLEFGNVTNSANGQLLGGAAVARIHLQASASASAFVIRVETSPVAFELRLDSTATLNGQSTTMTAVVQVDDQGTTAVNSLRVRQL
jgi:Tfp pilus assembly protein PilX